MSDSNAVNTAPSVDSTVRFQVSARISRPVPEVFEAVADPGELSQYFTTGGAEGRLVSGATVTWEFADFPGPFPVEVVEVVDNERIVLQWEPAADATPDNRPTTITMTFAPLDNGARTVVTIAEEGWLDTPAGREASYGNCGGWMQMLCTMKAWVEFRINLREGLNV